MLVIHPKDKTTAMLSALYDGLEAQVIADCRSIKEMAHLLHHVSTQERIMLLGHGSDKGLFFRADDSKDEFDKIIVGHPHAYHLRKHGGNIVAVWCNAEGDNQGTATTPWRISSRYIRRYRCRKGSLRMTLFDAVSPDDIFQEVLDAFYGGTYDKMTLDYM